MSSKLAKRIGFESIGNYIANTVWAFDQFKNDGIKLVWVEPENIQYRFTPPFNFRGRTAVYGTGSGNWYKSKRDYEEGKVYQSIRQFYNNEKAWEETPRGREMKERIGRGKTSWDSMKTYTEHVKRLIHNIEKQGYKTQEELDEKSKQKIGQINVPDEVRVCIGPDGELMQLPYQSHRGAIAKVCGVEKIPALVQIIHADWDCRLASEFNILNHYDK